LRFFHAPDTQWHRDVVQRGEFGQQMVELIDKAQRLVAQRVALALFHGGEGLAEQRDAAVGDEREERRERLVRPRRHRGVCTESSSSLLLSRSSGGPGFVGA
jgi:hypothetical protein